MKTLCWIRRDLRLHDHVALHHALAHGETTMMFVFDKNILDKLTQNNDRRITFIYQCLEEIEKELQNWGSSLIIAYGKPEEEIPRIAQELKVKQVFYNRDYEPFAKKRDATVDKKLHALGIESLSFKDHAFYEAREILKPTGDLYKVFTPYKKRWLEKFYGHGGMVSDYECDLTKLQKFNNPKNILRFDWYKEISFEKNPPLLTGGTQQAWERLSQFSTQMAEYQELRNFPALPATSLLSVYLRFGALSIRDLIRASQEDQSEGARTWLSELIWRDFYLMILDAYPRVTKESFKVEYDQIKFPGGSALFKSWCQGQTGFPLVDAAMRCLNETGMMHNRLRMVVASFLCKTLLVHWRWGEKYFAEHLLDFDLAANNGGWQWSCGSGCDAQPYFRIFNPYTQSEKFDPEGEFIKRWCPELRHLRSPQIHRPDKLLAPAYPSPVVSYELNRSRCLSLYSVVKK